MADYTKPDGTPYSDAELDALIAGSVNAAPGKGSQAQAQANAAIKEKSVRAEGPDPTVAQEMGVGEQILASIGLPANEIYQGAKEKLRLAFPGGENADQTRAEIAADRAARAKMQTELGNTTGGEIGGFLGNLLPAVGAPARIGAQAALEAGSQFLRPGTARPTGLPSELASSGLRGLEGAATVGVLGKGMQVAGKGLGAALGKTTTEGAEALAAKQSADRLGIPTPSVGQLYPGSPSAQLERGLPGSEDLTISQAKALRAALDRPTTTPEGAVIPNVGKAYQDELAEAVKRRYAISNDKYKAVDDIISSKGLGQLYPMYSARSVTNVNHPGYEVASDLLSRYGFDASSMSGMKSAQLGNIPLQFADYQTMRIAANKALNTIDRGISTAEKMGASIPSENKAARQWLTNFKTALDSDAERWASSNAGNKEAVGAFKDATAYFRDVVAPTVIENPIARKATSSRAGYKSGEEALRNATNVTSTPFIDRLLPTMTERGQDMTRVMRDLPDVRTTAMSRDLTVPTSEGGLGQVVRAAIGHPLTAAEMVVSRLPGMRDALTRSNVAHRIAAAPDMVSGAVPAFGPLSSVMSRNLPKQGAVKRGAWGSLQYPQEDAQGYIQKLIGNR